jgi:hypothetical protein
MNVLWIVVRGKQHDYDAMTLPPTHRYVYPKNVTVVKEAVEAGASFHTCVMSGFGLNSKCGSKLGVRSREGRAGV